MAAATGDQEGFERLGGIGGRNEEQREEEAAHGKKGEENRAKTPILSRKVQWGQKTKSPS